jgi:Isochorismatase family
LGKKGRECAILADGKYSDSLPRQRPRHSSQAQAKNPHWHRLRTNSLTVRIDAKPETNAIDISKTAVIVVDMQNDFGSKGGMLDSGGIDILGIRKAIGPTAKVLASARHAGAGIKIVYLKMAFRPDPSGFGAPDSPNRLKHPPIAAELLATTC